MSPEELRPSRGGWIVFIVGIAAVLAFSIYRGPPDQATYTLYRSSMTGASTRIHVATFDAEDGEEYNRVNCGLVQEQLQGRLQPAAKYWCERGRFKR